jgi:hypothetical protein
MWKQKKHEFHWQNSPVWTKNFSLNFVKSGDFFGQLSEKRWEIVRACQGKGELSVRELARAVGHDVKRVREDVRRWQSWAWCVMASLWSWLCAQQSRFGERAV